MVCRNITSLLRLIWAKVTLYLECSHIGQFEYGFLITTRENSNEINWTRGRELSSLYIGHYLNFHVDNQCKIGHIHFISSSSISEGSAKKKWDHKITQ